MAEISSITLPSGSTYDFKDAFARQVITGSIKLKGVTTTPLTDGSTTNPIVINGDDYTAVSADAVIYENKEFVFAEDDKWHEFGDLTGLGALALKDAASGTYTPTGSVSTPTFTGSSLTSTGTYTPAGSVSKPDVTVTPTTTTVNSITAVGTLPSLGMTVADENLTVSFSQGTLPEKGSDTSVMTGASAELDATPTFTGTEATLSVSGTPAGTVSQPTFTGTSATITVS